MIRIILNIEQSSPFLQTVSGEIVVDHVDFRRPNMPVENVLNCKFNIKPNSIGYSNISGFNSQLFEAIKPQIDVMIHSYKRGMILAPSDFSWIEDSNNLSVDEWLKMKGVESEISNKDQFQRE